MGKTRFQKIEEKHLIDLGEGKKALTVGLHIIHEVTSPQAFVVLDKMNIKVLRPENTFAVTDHVVNTGGSSPANDLMDEILIKTLEDNCEKHGITLYGQHNGKQGVCHVVAPEIGLSRPNSTIFCGDSHTSTHGAFGSIAAGIGTSNVRDILATGCLLNYQAPKQMKIEINGVLAPHLTAKDVILFILSKLGNEWATGGAVFFTGDIFRNMSMPGRMTVCNMTIEMGGRFGYCDVDQTTLDWFSKNRDFFESEDLDKFKEEWLSFNTDADAHFDKTASYDASEIKQMISWGLSLNDISDVDASIGKVENVHSSRKKWEPEIGSSLKDIDFQHAFIGSCTNGRLEDFKSAAEMIKKAGGKIAIKSALAVPGSIEVKKECEELGIDKVFTDAGWEWRKPGCSSCLAMNPDKFTGRVASSTNRNFPGRQGPESRTFLMSPASVALVAMKGKLVNTKEYL